jgi:hypothetical protein
VLNSKCLRMLALKQMFMEVCRFFKNVDFLDFISLLRAFFLLLLILITSNKYEKPPIFSKNSVYRFKLYIIKFK